MRRLRLGARRVDPAPGALVSPVDGIVLHTGSADVVDLSSTIIRVKVSERGDVAEAAGSCGEAAGWGHTCSTRALVTSLQTDRMMNSSHILCPIGEDGCKQV